MNTIECAFAGRVGTEPELRTSQAGKPWTAFNVGVGEGDNLQWVRVAVFNDLAEALASSLHKGDRIYCEGSIKLNTWTGQEGEQRSGLSVAAWKAEKLGQIGRSKPRKAQEAAGHQPEPQAGFDARRDWQAPAGRQAPQREPDRRQVADDEAIQF